MDRNLIFEELKKYLAENLEEPIGAKSERKLLSAYHAFAKKEKEACLMPDESILYENEPEESSVFAENIDMDLDESFSEMLLRKIDESGMKDSECYKRANVSKQVFSNIRSGDGYVPSKTTALAFAIALRMDLEETKKLLERAGYALSHSYRLDVIVEYFIKKGIYDLDEINAALYEFDQKLLGTR